MSQPEHGLSWKREPKLVSRWAEGLARATPLPEYPRPQLVRKQWLNLNGEWEFLGEGPEPPELPADFPEKALVPSATQAVTSCLEKEWTRGWYRKTFEIPAEWGEKKVLLHFESIGGISTVYLDGKSYTGGAQDIILFATPNLASTMSPANITLTNFPAWATVTVEQDNVTTHDVVLHIAGVPGKR